MSAGVRPKFPGRVQLQLGARRRRVRKDVVETNIREMVGVGENVARGIHTFYTLVGSMSDEEVRKINLLPLSLESREKKKVEIYSSLIEFLRSVCVIQQEKE